jgi:ribosomal protein S18 acetylase RimI-like enzyme
MSLLQRLLSPFVREYWIGRTFLHRAGGMPALPLMPLSPDLEFSSLAREDMAAIRLSRDHELQRRSSLPGPGSLRFGARANGLLVGVCSFGFGEGYLRSGGFYDLAPGEAELTDIFTSSVCRGRGIASGLIRFSTERIHEQGFQTLYARVWHSNVASSRAFLAAGWEQSCFFIRFNPRGTSSVCHMEWRQRTAH